MQKTLPISGKTATLRAFLPHGVLARFNEAMFKGVGLAGSVAAPTNQELIDEFGAEAMSAADALPDNERDARLQMLREQYLSRRLKLEGMSVGNVHEANLRKLEGMVTAIDADPCSRKEIEELPQEDVETLLEAIEEIAEAQRKKKKASARSAN